MPEPDVDTAPTKSIEELPAPPMTGRAILRRAVVYTPAYAVPALLGTASIPILGRELRPAQFGVYSICLSLHGIMLTFAADPTSNALRRMYSRERSSQGRDALVRATFGLTLVLAASVCLVSFAVSALLVSIVGLRGWLAPLAGTAAMTAGFAVFQFLLTVDYVRERAMTTSSWQVAHSVTKTVALAGGAIAFGRAAAALFAYAAALPFLCLGRLKGTIPPRGKLVDRQLWSRSLRYGVPLIAVSLSFVVLAGFDRICLAVLRGEGVAGRYAAAYLIADASISLMATLMHYTVYTSILAAWEAGDEQAVHRLIGRTTDAFMVFAFLVVSLFSVAGVQIIRIVAGPSFKVASTVPALVAGALTLYRSGYLQSVGFDLRMDSRALARTFLTTAGVCIPLTIVAIILFGAVGAAAATLASYGLFLVLVRRGSPVRATLYPARRMYLALATIAGASTALLLIR